MRQKSQNENQIRIEFFLKKETTGFYFISFFFFFKKKKRCNKIDFWKRVKKQRAAASTKT